MFGVHPLFISCVFSTFFVSLILSIPIAIFQKQNSQYRNTVCNITNISIIDVKCGKRNTCYNGIIYVKYDTIDNHQYNSNLSVLKDSNKQYLEENLFKNFYVNKSIDCFYKINNPEKILLELHKTLHLCIFALVLIICGSLGLIILIICKIKRKNNKSTDIQTI